MGINTCKNPVHNSIKRAALSLLIAACLVLPFSGCYQTQAVTTPPSTRASTAAGETGVIDEAWQIIHDKYVQPDKINSPNMTSAAVKGMVAALNDPYTRYLSPQAYQLRLQDQKGKYQGIGVQVSSRSGKYTIISTIPGSPAEKAGLTAGDTILAIDGQRVSDMSPEDAQLKVRGLAGTSVKLLVIHQTKTEPEEISIVRGDIDLITVRFEMKGDIAYIRIYQFNERTDQELNDIMKNSKSLTGATGIVLDLRSNPGGLVSTVVKVVSHFIDEGVVVYTIDNRGIKKSSSVNATGITTGLPIVILSDNFSASGSEVVMGALQDYGRATIAGTKTFGKGSVDRFFRLKDGSALYVTTGRWTTPNGRLIEGKGIEPDIKLDLKGDDAVQWAIDYLHNKKN
jgi:carboxyl-terminal processing protease